MATVAKINGTAIADIAKIAGLAKAGVKINGVDVPSGGALSTVSGNTEFIFESANTVYSTVGTISSTQCLVCYSDVGNSYYGTAQILDRAGGTITGNTPLVIGYAATYYGN